MALAAGAPWIARAYSGNPNQMAQIIAEAIEHRGFSFVHVLSQCITFCPEQTDWKAIVNERDDAPLEDPAEAAALLMGEAGFQTGLLYTQPRSAWPPAVERPAAVPVDQLASAFEA